jgi:hypothetical protein
MAKKTYSQSTTTIQRWIKDGRGSGRGSAYKPWLTVRDVPSQGRSHRIFGHKSRRIHHLFSDLELAVFLILEWQPDILEIREQFPLQIDVTENLAATQGITHPAVSGKNQIMTSDFLVNSSRSGNPKFVLQAKYTDDLAKPRVIEKLELERRYWEQKGIPWLMVTQEDVSQTVFQNISWLYAAQQDEIPKDDLERRIEFYTHHFSKDSDIPLVELAKSFDINYSLPTGASLKEIRYLLAQRFFPFDIRKANHKLTPNDLVFSNTEIMQEISHAQGE